MKLSAKLKIGRRYSIQRITGLSNCGPLPGACGLVLMVLFLDPGGSADLNHVVLGEDVVGHVQIARRGPAADPTGGVVYRAVAGAEPAAVFAVRLIRLLPERNAAQMGADADDHEPLRLDHAL